MSEILLPLTPALPNVGVRVAPEGTSDAAAAPEAFASHIERALRTSFAMPLGAAPDDVMAIPLGGDAGDEGNDAAATDENDADIAMTHDDERGLDAIRALVASVADSALTSAAAPDASRATVVANPTPIPMRPTDRDGVREERRTPVANDRMVVRDIEALDPELRVRVERVIGRMEEEFGHDVQLAETWRSQTRQNDLYAQGRTRSGEVVTWTRHSRHTEGLAADFVVDGDWDNPVAYERLQRIANEEGLRTLGTKDAGHVELDASAARGMRASTMAATGPTMMDAATETGSDDERVLFNSTRNAEPRIPQRTAAPGIVRPGIASTRVAAVAQIAAVAQPGIARVQAVATVASPAVYAASPRTEGPVARDEDRQARTSEDPSQNELAPFVESRAQHRPATQSVAEPQAIRATTGIRAEHIETLRDLVRSQPVSGLVLRVDSASGIDDRIRIDVHGTRVETSIGVSNEIRANDLARRIPELTRALEARGFEAGATQIHPTSAGVRIHEATGAASQVAEQLAIDAFSNTAQTRRDAHTRSDDEPPPRSHQQASRERSRRERQGDHT